MTREEFLGAVLQLITENHGDEGLFAAHLGSLVRRAYEGFDWKALGFRNLSAILDVLENGRLVRRETNEKGALRVWSTEEGAKASGSSISWVESPTQGVRLRKDIWSAFVLEVPLGLRYFDKESQSVVMGLSRALQKPPSWVEIPPIARQTQQEWAHEILAESDLSSDTELLQALAEERWFIKFTEALRIRAHHLWLSWNRKRTCGVVAHVRKWAKDNTISFESLVDVSKRRAEKTSRFLTADDRQLRRTLMAIIERMTTSELLDIRVPLRYAIDVAGARGSPISGEKEQ